MNTLTLNTGYNYSTFSLYAPSSADGYWLNIASYPPTTPVAPTSSWVYGPPPVPWSAAFSGSSWIGPRKTPASAPGTNPNNPAYTIFKKCFCLLPNGFNDATLTFQIRADDKVQVWLNTITNIVLPPSLGAFSSTAAPLTGGTAKGKQGTEAGFHVGLNCLYVLVEDTLGGQMGFDLAGGVSATGLLPMAAAGTDSSFGPCRCIGGAGPAGGPLAAGEKQMIDAIVKVVQDRRVSNRV